MRVRGWLAVAAMLPLAGGCGACTTESGTSGDSEQLEFALRTGEGCGAGCALDDRPLMVGTEDRIVVTGVPAGAGTLRVRTSDPGVVTAWVEPSRLCCGAGRCDALEGAEMCAGQEQIIEAIAVRAVGPGDSAMVIFDETGQRLDSTTLRAERAAQVVATADLTSLGELPDVVGYDTASMRGDLERIELRVGTATLLRLEARSAAGELLHVGAAAGFRVADPTVATLAPRLRSHAGLGVQELGGTRAVLVPRRAGQTTLALAAGGATGVVAVTALPACDPITPDVVWSADACDSDDDCAPAGCCHARTCGAAIASPSCEGVSCTLECQAGSVDCDGRCLCLQGRCAAYRYAIDDPSCAAPGRPLIPWFPVPREPEPGVETRVDPSPADPARPNPRTYRAVEREPTHMQIPPPPDDWGVPRWGE